MRQGDIVIISGNAHPKLARDICEYVGVELGDAHCGRFPDGEIDVKVNSDVRGADCFVVQPTCAPVNENLMELLILVDCLKRASARRITVVIPYFGYARQDRKDEGRVPITAKLVANLLERAGAHRVLTVDLHAAQIQGFFDVPVDHLYASPVLAGYFRQKRIPDLVVASPDIGGSKMAWGYSKRLDAYFAMVEKRRVSPQHTEVQFVIGDVRGKNVLLVDDMISTGGSIVEAARALKEKGAEKIYICATHGVLAGNAVEKLRKAPVEQVVITDTVPVEDKPLPDNFHVASVAPLLGEAIRRIHHHESISSLFREKSVALRAHV
ncbi:MAG: ribose-phosphate pyrophosphokinase [Planctomycetota bacterium]|nr:MAG: ribose-phosphate pyrophosphokinase [Planctomycetota bacterium]